LHLSLLDTFDFTASEICVGVSSAVWACRIIVSERVRPVGGCGSICAVLKGT
jgi:hypothetical protein